MFDAHCHLHRAPLLRATADAAVDLERFNHVVARCERVNVQRFALCAVNVRDWEDVAFVTSRFPAMVPHYGVHPWWAHEIDQPMALGDKLREMLRTQPRAHVGEIGLDKTRAKHVPMDKQRELFRLQLRIAGEFSRVSSCHCVQAVGALVEDLKTVNTLSPVVLHSFGGPRDIIPVLLAAAPEVYFSIGTTVHRPKVRDALRVIPLDRLLVESDCPDQPPPPDAWLDRTGWLANEPACIPWVVSQVAEVLGKTPAQVATLTTENSARIYPA